MRRSAFVLGLLVYLFVASSSQAQTCTWDSSTPNNLFESCGRVFIGPYPQLSLKDPSPSHSVLLLIERGSAGPNAGLVFRTTTADVVTGVNNEWTIGRSGAAGQETLYFSLPAAGDEFGNPKVAFWTDGKVGIGTGRNAPAATLDVNGGIHANGTISGNNVVANYQDVAEWVPASADLDPGTVVVLDPSHDNRVMPSARSYDTTVAGVVSAKPGVILGVAGADKEQIATTGRVKVKVDATRSPISIGDLLVTGDRPGTAMKSEPLQVAGALIHRPGTVIGKALQALPNGEGEILVLLSLQ